MKAEILNSNNIEILTQRDRELILEQCIHQNATTPDQIEGFTNAYALAKNFAFTTNWDDINERNVLDLIFALGRLTEKSLNANGFRKIEVVFANGSRAIKAANIPHAMEGWAQTFAENRLEPQFLFKEFEEIHPFVDGNGRVGDLFWKIAVKRNLGEWPQSLPPRFEDIKFSNDDSAFGEVE